MKPWVALRCLTIVMAAVLVNAIMFGVIEYMVVDRQIRLTKTADFEIANFIRFQEQTQQVRSRRDPKAPSKPDTAAQQDFTKLTQASNNSDVGALAVDLPGIEINAGGTGGLPVGAIARELTPLVRFPPDYPERALRQKIEGSVVLRFTVTEAGGVTDPEVVSAEPPGVFEEAALRTVLRWKYQPQLADGKPVSVITYTRVVFYIDQGGPK